MVLEVTVRYEVWVVGRSGLFRDGASLGRVLAIL
jgi:hypothetical protein